MIRSNRLVLIDEDTLGRMLVSAVRYALGRQSYIVSETCTWVRDYWAYLPSGLQDILIDDLGDCLREMRALNLWYEVVDNQWVDLRNWALDLRGKALKEQVSNWPYQRSNEEPTTQEEG